jgi:hypothetical protein
MTTDPRAALTALVAAFERHLEAAASRRGENDPVVLASYRDLAATFEAYDDALLDAFDEVTPFEVFREDDPDGEEEEFDEPDDVEDGSYTGLADQDYVEDEEGTDPTPRPPAPAQHWPSAH